VKHPTSSPTDRRAFLRALAGAGGAAALAPALGRYEALAHEIASLQGGAWSAPALRERYLLAADVSYLNHASIGTVPKAVHEAHVAYLRLCESNPWLYMWGGAWEEPRERVRAAVAGVLGTSPDRVTLTHNTTEGFSMVAAGLDLGPRDEVLFSSFNHPGASVCWEHHAARRGYRVRRFALAATDAPGWSADDLVRLHVEQIRPETRVLVVPHVDNIVGVRLPLERLVRAARDAGVAWVLVDGAQSAGMIPVDVDLSGVDGFSTSPHKWLQAPKGLGALVLTPDLRARVHPTWVTWGQERWAGTARALEDYGTRNLPELMALEDAIAFQRALGVDAKERHYRALRDHLRARVEASPALAWGSPTSWDLGASLCSIRVRGRPAADVSAELYERFGTVVRPFDLGGVQALRVSPNVMNDRAEIDRFVEHVEALL